MKPTDDAHHLPEHHFRRILGVSRVGDSGLEHAIEATTAECADIAKFLDIVSVKFLKGSFTLKPWRARGLSLRGVVTAQVEQACVVTLEPVLENLSIEFERRYFPDVEARVPDQHAEVFIDPDAEDPPEPLTRELDLGAIAVEELSLNLDPYPKKPGVEFRSAESLDIEEKTKPFAALAKLKLTKPPGSGQKG